MMISSCLLLLSSSVALDCMPLQRRAMCLGSAAAVLTSSKVSAMAEWSCALDSDWKITKRQESSVRIRPETMLTASKEKMDIKLVKIPLGRSAATNFEPDEQLDLAMFFNSRADAERITDQRIREIFQRSLDRQAQAPSSPLQSASVTTVATTTRRNRRYVSLDYVTDGCRKIDEDGACVGRAKRQANAVLTVSLESQARTLEEQRRMDRGDMEERYIDTLWLFTATAPLASGKKGDGLTDAERIARFVSLLCL